MNSLPLRLFVCAGALASLGGCGAQSNGPKDQLSPEEAKKHLVLFLESGSKGWITHPDGPSMEAILSSQGWINDLKESAIHSEGQVHYLGAGWAFGSNNLRLSVMVPFQGHQYALQGRFEKNKSGRWEPIIEGVSHMNLGPPWEAKEGRK